MNLSDMPAWLVGVILALALPLAIEVGYRLHRLIDRKGDDGDSSGGAGHIVSAALGLLGLLIGFTFAMSTERYEARRHLVVEEANAISTTWLRQQLFDEPERGRLAALMRAYVKERQAFVSAGVDQARLDADWARTSTLQERIWRETAIAVDQPASASVTNGLLQATNQMFDLASSRRAALDARVPAAILWALIAFATATATIMGYGFSTTGRRHWVASSGLFMLVALAIALILDLDQPRAGSIRVLQTPLDRVAGDILRVPPPH